MPTWNALGRDPSELTVTTHWPGVMPPNAAWGRATGRGVRVCLVDSGAAADHPLGALWQPIGEACSRIATMQGRCRPSHAERASSERVARSLDEVAGSTEPAGANPSPVCLRNSGPPDAWRDNRSRTWMIRAFNVLAIPSSGALSYQDCRMVCGPNDPALSIKGASPVGFS